MLLYTRHSFRSSILRNSFFAASTGRAISWSHLRCGSIVPGAGSVSAEAGVEHPGLKIHRSRKKSLQEGCEGEGEKIKAVIESSHRVNDNKRLRRILRRPGDSQTLKAEEQVGCITRRVKTGSLSGTRHVELAPAVVGSVIGIKRTAPAVPIVIASQNPSPKVNRRGSIRSYKTGGVRKNRKTIISRITDLSKIKTVRNVFGIPIPVIFDPLRRRKERKAEEAEAARIRKLKPPYCTKMKSWVQFLTTPTADTPGTCLLLHFDNRRYLIGHVAEGTQRACVQRKVALMKVEDIFLTGQINWATTGGILGMILTLADGKSSSASENTSKSKHGGAQSVLRLHGGENLTHMLATARKFVFRKGLPLAVDECRPQNTVGTEAILPNFEDDNIKVWTMAIVPSSTNGGSDDVAVRSRKRSHEEMTEFGGKGDAQETEEEREDRYDQIRRGVVAHMFDSDWRLDSLVAMKLSEVQMPATIFERRNGKIEKYEGPLPNEADALPTDPEVLIRRPWPGAMVDSLPPTKPSKMSTSYILKNHPQRGKFNPQAAIKLGVKPGAKFRTLTMGQSVLSEDGKTVTPDMVLAPGKEGGGFAVLDIPDRSYIEATLNRPELASEEIMKGIGAIVWMLGAGVYGDERLADYMSNSKLEHIISAPDVCPNMIALESPASAAIRLNMLDDSRFPIPVHNNVPKVNIIDSGNVSVARIGKKVELEPAFKVTEELASLFLDTGAVVQAMPEDVLRLGEEARQHTESTEYLANLASKQVDLLCKDAEITTLGTGSALPSKYRNVSATLLRIPEFGNYLLDAGENTMGQLKRVFGDELPDILKNLKLLWISHLHADHHLGTASVIKAWHEATKDDPATKDNKLMVSSASGMLKWLTEYSSVEDYGFSRLMLVDVSAANKQYMTEYQISAFNLMSITAVRVNHCHQAMAVVLEMPNGFKVAYSGDCRPSNDFAIAGKGATLLIHEATFDDEMQGDAIAKRHSTTAEALDIGRRMEARRIVLTHFSQRYQKIPVMENTHGKDQVAIVAFDYMKCKIGDFAKLAAYRPALLKLYEEKDKDD